MDVQASTQPKIASTAMTFSAGAETSASRSANSTQPPTSAQAQAALREARMMFTRALAGWAGDALKLRRTSGHALTWPSRPARRLKAA